MSDYICSDEIYDRIFMPFSSAFSQFICYQLITNTTLFDLPLIAHMFSRTASLQAIARWMSIVAD